VADVFQCRNTTDLVRVVRYQFAISLSLSSLVYHHFPCSILQQVRHLNETTKIVLMVSRRGHVTYFWNFGTAPYLWERISNNTAVDRAILSKFGFERDLNIAKRVLLLKPKPGWISVSIWPQFFYNFFWKSIWRHNFALSGSVWMKFGRQTLNHVEKNSKYYCKKT